MKNYDACNRASKYEFLRPYCPIISYQKEHNTSQNCMGSNCVFYLYEKCGLAYKIDLEIQLLEKQLGKNLIKPLTSCENVEE